ncbi:MAG: amino acid ABC transporter permease, partial [Alphaproteobacteria bacterium]
IFFWWGAVIKSLPGVRDAMRIGDGVFLSNRGLVFPRPIAEAPFDWVFGVFVVGLIATFVLRRWAHRRQERTGRQFPTFYAGFGMVIGAPVVLGGALWLFGARPLSFELPELGAFSFSGGFTVLPEFAGLLIALVTYTSAYIAEVVRAGIVSVSHGQTEAAHALGLKPRWTLNLIVIPQAMRVIIPPLTNQYLNLTKNSSLGTAIGYPELVAVFGQTVLTQTGQAIEVIGITMATYLTISIATSAGMNWYNRRKQLVVR